MSNQTTCKILIRASRHSSVSLSPCLQSLVASLNGQLDALEPGLWAVSSPWAPDHAARFLGELFESGLVSYLGFEQT